MSQQPNTPDEPARYWLSIPYDPLYAAECITEPFTANGHTIQWSSNSETEYFMESDLDEAELTEIVKQQFKHFDDTKGHDTSDWMFGKVLLY